MTIINTIFASKVASASDIAPPNKLLCSLTKYKVKPNIDISLKRRRKNICQFLPNDI